jgi:hypothetical protein
MKKSYLLLGDLIALFITTLIGFITHREADLSFMLRFAAIYFPLAILWLLIASWFGLFQFEIASTPKGLWRVPLTMLIVAPLAVLSRAWILQVAVIPIFMVALGGTSACGLLLWRGIYIFLNRRAH